MQAITIDHEGAAPALRSDVPSPTPVAGEVLVRVRASSLNPIDGAIAVGMLKGMVEHEYPITLGRDFAGTVEAVGDGRHLGRRGRRGVRGNHRRLAHPPCRRLG